ncbi:hypothetical protein D3C80_2028560 [compost metagenome]
MHGAFDEGVAVPGFAVELVDGVAHQTGRALGFVEEQQGRINDLAVGETADAQAIAVL